MARGFGVTFGTGSTDKITTGFSAALSATHTVSVWLYENGAGGASKGKIFDASNNTNGPEMGDNSANVANTMLVGENFSTTQGGWYYTRPSLGVWHHHCFTYNGSSTANAPVVYVDGASVSVTTLTTPVGSYAGASNTLYLGNRADGARNWDGNIAEFALWNGGILSASEVAALAKGVSPLFVRPASLSLYLPLFGTQANEPDWGPSHVPQTITGAKSQNHAPVSLWMPGAPAAPGYNYSGSLSLTQGASTAAINQNVGDSTSPGQVSVSDAAQGGCLSLTDAGLYRVQITESV